MHELWIAHSLVRMADDAAARAGATAVRAVRVRVGALSGVAREALEFCFDVAAAGTRTAGARLEVAEVPLVVHCSACDRDAALPGVQDLRCPACGIPTGDVRQGRELELESVEVEVPSDAA
jgi:hydrogenase nickel incorporation protein HypA/HybF